MIGTNQFPSDKFHWYIRLQSRCEGQGHGARIPEKSDVPDTQPGVCDQTFGLPAVPGTLSYGRMEIADGKDEQEEQVQEEKQRLYPTLLRRSETGGNRFYGKAVDPQKSHRSGRYNQRSGFEFCN